MTELNRQQQEAVNHHEGPLLLVAGAGTGKTTVITQRIANLITGGHCRSEEILALTFTDKAAGEMEERVDRLLPYGYVDLWISTFHAFADRVLKEHGLEIGLPTGFKLLSATGQWLLARQNLDKFKLDYYRPLGHPAKHIHSLISHFSRAKDENISVEDYQKYVAALDEITDQPALARKLLDAKIIDRLTAAELNEAIALERQKRGEIAAAYQTYQQLLLDNNALDFGDLITYALKLFQSRKNILAQYRQQFKYILVDEFQDTNFAQYELVKLLAAPANNLTVVGDDDQAIYKFRGASVANILQFKTDFPQAKEIYLTANYRSAQKLLDLAYKFIQLNNPDRLEARLAGGENNLSKRLTANTTAGGELLHLHGRTLEDEVNLVVEKIIEIYNREKDLQWSDFAILTRANSAADDFLPALEQAKIPYAFLASRGLYGKKIVLDVLAFLRLLDDYHEGPAMYRFLTMPLWRIPPADLVNFNYWAKRRGESLFVVLQSAEQLPNISVAGRQATARVIELLAKYSDQVAGGGKTTEIIQAFLDESGYLKLLTAEDSGNNRQELSYLNQFFKKIRDFEKENNGYSVKSFLALMELELEAGEPGALAGTTESDDPNTLKIMTVHAAKGLEFAYVFLPNLVDKRFPTIAKGEAIELPEELIKEEAPTGDIHLQEERRLFYVALTRAKRGICFSSAEDYGGATKKKLSRFLAELAEQGFKLAPTAQISAISRPITPSRQTPESSKPPLPAKFSFTRLKAFANCPYQYRFAFVLKVPVSGRPQFSFGRTMHNSLQKIFQLVNQRVYPSQPELLATDSKTTIDWEEVAAIYRESFIDDWYPDRATRDRYWRQGEESLKKFYEQNQNNWPRAIHLEYSFNWRLTDEQKNSFTLYGVIDRIDRVDGGVRIVDYKTGAAKDKLSLDDKEQLLIYQMAVEEVLKETVKELVFHYLDDNRQVSFLGKDQELEKIKQKIFTNIAGIKLAEFPPKPGMICRFCDFKSICDYRQG